MADSTEQVELAIKAKVHNFLVGINGKKMTRPMLEALCTELNDYIKSTGVEEQSKMSHMIEIVGTGDNIGLSFERKSTVKSTLVDTERNEDLKAYGQISFEAYHESLKASDPSTIIVAWESISTNAQNAWEAAANEAVARYQKHG